MAKKKNSQFLPGLLEDIMSLLTPEEQEIAFELFNDGANQVDEELSHIYYHHQCPDYRLIAQPIAYRYWSKYSRRSWRSCCYRKYDTTF